jgi:hypothetical protein
VKVTKLKRGYVIRLNDTEFAALEQLVAHGESEFQGVDPCAEYGVPRRISNAMFGLHMGCLPMRKLRG